MSDTVAEAVASMLRDIVVKPEPREHFASPPRYAVWDNRQSPPLKVSMPGKHAPTVERKIALQTGMIIKLFKGTQLPPEVARFLAGEGEG